jgi:hypothetical protein
LVAKMKLVEEVTVVLMEMIVEDESTQRMLQ